MAGSKVKDTQQEYQFSQPYISPSGHEFSFYDTPENERLVVRHTSGSHIEFKADGSIFLKSVKDIHTHSSVLSSQSESLADAESTTNRIDTDYVWEVAGRLKIKCSELDVEVGSTGRVYCGTDLIVSANNLMEKATESISLEGTKSIYMDTKEVRERIVSRRSEVGTAEDSGQGGLNILNVHGNALIRNDDPNGGITIASRGYLNLVCGQERVDVTGRWTTTPSQEGEATYTHKVYAPQQPGEQANSVPGGDIWVESDSTAYYRYALKGPDPKHTPYGFIEDVFIGSMYQRVQNDRVRKVQGSETVDVFGIQKITATKIFLN